MEPTAAQLLAAIQATSDDVEALRGDTLTSKMVSRAVAEGIKSAMSDPEVWSAAVMAIQAHAKSEAGGWLFGGLRAILSRVGWILVIGGGVWLVGGWSALAALWKSGAHP